MPLLLLALLAAGAPSAALYQSTPDAVTVARAEPPHEYARAAAEYGASLAAFTGVNAIGSALLSQGHFTVGGGHASYDGSTAALGGALGCFVLSPFVAALTSWIVGNGSDAWEPHLGWATMGAYGTSLLALGAGQGLALAGVSRDTAVAADAALYLAVPLGAVLLQNATQTPHP